MLTVEKVRCDAHEKLPNSCTRCTKKNLTCVLQPDFKRTYKRRRLVEVEKEMERLKNTLELQEHEKRRIVSGSLLDLSNSSAGLTSNASTPTFASPETVLQYNDLPPPQREKHVETPSSMGSTPHDHPSFHDTPGASSSSAQNNHHRPGAATIGGQVDLDFSGFECTEKSMDGVTLSPEAISNLYKEYVIKYHPFLPVVDVSRGPEKIYELCPSLFWTIMAVASRRYDKDGGLMMQLTPLLKTCLSEITISPINRFVSKKEDGPTLNVASAYTVQAFLIYTMWPSITSTLSADSSWSTAGIAMYSAIRVGLHCPGYARDFGRIKADNPSYPKISEQIRTWVGCNIVSQTIATVYGFPAFTSFDATVLSACDTDSGIEVPETLRQLMQIQHLEEEIAKTLNSNPKDPLGLSELSERLSLIQILSRKMDELELKLGDIDDCRKFVLLSARVHLLTYYFLDNDGFSDLQLQKGMVHVYNSALALMEHSERAHRRDRSFFRYMPSIYAQALWQSSCIVCRIYHSPLGQFINSSAGKQTYTACVSLISKASILKHDMMYRAAEIMQQVWRLYGALAKRNSGGMAPRTVIRTRMSASVFFDSLWTLREEIGIRSVAPTVLDQRNPADADDEDYEAEMTTPAITNVTAPVSVTSSDLVMTSPIRNPKTPDVGQLKIKAEPAPMRGISTRGRGRGRGSGRRKNEIKHFSTDDKILSSSINAAASTSLTTAPDAVNGVTVEFSAFNNDNKKPPLGFHGDGSVNSGVSVHSENENEFSTLVSSDSINQNFRVQQQRQPLQDSVINEIDFYSWEADTIWRDVDMLMSDFGFRIEEAPTGSNNVVKR